MPVTILPNLTRDIKSSLGQNQKKEPVTNRDIPKSVTDYFFTAKLVEKNPSTYVGQIKITPKESLIFIKN